MLKVLGLLGKLRALLAPKAAPAEASPAAGPAPAGVNPSADIDDLKTSLRDIRTSLRQWTVGVGAVATALLTGVGWTQADRLFPLAGPSWVPWLAGTSAVAAVVAGVYVLVSLYAAQTRILIGNEDELGRYSIRFRPKEKPLVLTALADQAAVEGAPQLRDVDLRAQRLLRIASRLKLEDDRKFAEAARKEADRLNAYLGLAEMRVVLMLLERRALYVTRIKSFTALALLVAALGIAGVFTAANFSKGARPAPASPAKAQQK